MQNETKTSQKKVENPNKKESQYRKEHHVRFEIESEESSSSELSENEAMDEVFNFKDIQDELQNFKTNEMNSFQRINYIFSDMSSS